MKELKFRLGQWVSNENGQIGEIKSVDHWDCFHAYFINGMGWQAESSLTLADMRAIDFIQAHGGNTGVALLAALQRIGILPEPPVMVAGVTAEEVVNLGEGISQYTPVKIGKEWDSPKGFSEKCLITKPEISVHTAEHPNRPGYTVVVFKDNRNWPEPRR